MDKAIAAMLKGVKEKKMERKLAIELIQMLERDQHKQGTDIAVIGIASRMPSIRDLREYWDVITGGVDCIAPFPPDRRRDIVRYLAFRGMPEADIRFTRSAYLTEIDKFDYSFFNLSPREAGLMDPAQRLFLETSWQAIEDAGYGGRALEGSKTGVYVGFASNIRDMYAKMIEHADPDGLPIGMVGNLTAVIPSRLSYLLDLKGPSMVIDTACSSSLVAIDTACQALRNGVCDMAIAGGININTMPLDHDSMQTGIESSDGLSRTFDDYADGSGIGEGVGAIVLKPLTQAKADRDHIYAVIKGSAANQDGRAAGITAPNPQAQTDVILQAWETAGIDPETIQYVETHGTGTNLGDPIEIQGIRQAFRRHTDKQQFCAVSSVKTNIGHLSEAAGIFSVIKAILALRHRLIPPSIHFGKPNRSIPFERSPVYVNTRPRPWATAGHPRRCGVSAFGISGTNCHIVLEEAPVSDHPDASAKPEQKEARLFVLSAKTETALRALVEQYAAELERQVAGRLADICYTASTGRGHYGHRLAFIVSSMSELRDTLTQIQWPARTPASEPVVDLDGADGVYGYHRVVDHARKSNSGSDLTPGEQEKLNKDAEACVTLLSSDEPDTVHILRDTARLYAKGADIDWNRLYDGIRPCRVPLPVYPFERTRCWLHVPEASISTGESARPPLYEMTWVRESLTDEAEHIAVGEVLVVKDEQAPEFVQELIRAMQARGIGTVVATLGDRYEHVGECEFVIGPEEEDLDRLLVDTEPFEPTHVLHMCGLGRRPAESLAELEEGQQIGVFHLFGLARAMMRHARKSNWHLLLFSSCLYAVTGREPGLNPESATMVGLGKVIGQEFSQAVCKAIDVDLNTPVTAILPELEKFTKSYQAVYREGERYVEQYGPAEPAHRPVSEYAVREGGTYIVTGGLGGIGLEMAKYLATESKVKIALIGRSPFPGRDEWNEIVHKAEAAASDAEEHADDDESREQSIVELAHKIRTLQSIEQSGSEVAVFQADVADERSMSSVIDRIRRQFGRIRGVFHGAGIAGAGYLYTKDRSVFEQVLKAKVAGTWILDKLTEEDEPETFVMQSSGVTMIGEAGQGDYVAGNSYLNAFADFRRKHDRHALAVKWVSWKEAGMSVKYGINVDSFYKALPSQTAVRNLHAVLERDMTQVLIGELNETPEYITHLRLLPFRISPELEALCQRVIEQSGGEARMNGVISNGAYDAALLDKGKLIILPKGRKQAERPVSPGQVTLTGKDGDDYDAVEQQLADIFSEILGYPEIDIHDSLFELGGDSLLLMRIHKLVDDVFPGKVSITDMFEFPSVERLAAHIHRQEDSGAGQRDANPKPAHIDVRSEAKDIFGKLEEGTLSLEEAIDGIENL